MDLAKNMLIEGIQAFSLSPSRQNESKRPRQSHLGQHRERRLKSEFAFFQSLLQLFQLTYFVKCTRTLLNLNSKGPYLSPESEIKFRHCLFTFSIKHEIRYFHIVVAQKRQKNVQKKGYARAKLLFWLLNILFF